LLSLEELDLKQEFHCYEHLKQFDAWHQNQLMQVLEGQAAENTCPAAAIWKQLWQIETI